MRRIILASTSPRRKELLEMVGLQFEVIPTGYDEQMDNHTDPEKLVKLFSQEKAYSIQDDAPNAIIIAADTIVVLNGKIFGKPKNKEENIEMLRQLTGTTHTVMTGYTVLDTASQKIVTKVVKTHLTMVKLSLEEIITYIEKENPFDKSGGYSIQSRGSIFTEKIEGDYYNVVGLPVCSLAETLKEFGVYLL